MSLAYWPNIHLLFMRYLLFRRRRTNAIIATALPNNVSDAGSGTAVGVGGEPTVRVAALYVAPVPTVKLSAVMLKLAVEALLMVRAKSVEAGSDVATVEASPPTISVSTLPGT